MAKTQKSSTKKPLIIIGIAMVVILIILAIAPVLSAGKTKIVSIDKLLGLDMNDDTITTDVSGKTELKPETDKSESGTSYSTIVRLNYNLDPNVSKRQIGLVFCATYDNFGGNGYWISHNTEEFGSAFTGKQISNNSYSHQSVYIENANKKNITNSDNLTKLKNSSILVTQDGVDYKISYKYDYIKTMTIAFAVTKNYIYKNVSREVGVYKDIDVDFTNLTTQYVKNTAGEWEAVNVKIIIPVVFIIMEVPDVEINLDGGMSYPVIDTVDIKD